MRRFRFTGQSSDCGKEKTGNKQKERSIKKGESIKLRLCHLTPKQKKKVRWKSSKKSVASVTGNGRIKAKKKGKAVISAVYKKKKYRCVIRVVGKNKEEYVTGGKSSYRGFKVNYVLHSKRNGNIHYNAYFLGSYNGKNPFGLQLAGVVVNDSVTKEAISRNQMRKFLKFVHDDVVYCKYYEVVYILFHTGMRISEFCGLTLKDIDLENRIINIDHQLQRTSDMRYIIETTKTVAGTRKILITEDVAQMFQAIIEDREPLKTEKVIDGYTGFLFYDDNGNPLVAMHW